MSAIKELFTWLNDQLLKMVWLDRLVYQLVERGFGLKASERLGGSIQFFIYDTIKIFILLSVLIFAISFIQSYFPPKRTRKILGRFTGLWANALAALLGTVTPFCSCSSIPLFIGFTGAGLPIGVTFSFLISSPLVDLASILLLASIFSWRVAIAYVLVGLVLAVVGGTIISRLKLDDQVASFVYQQQTELEDSPVQTRRQRLFFAAEQVWAIIQKVWLYVLIGVGIGATIHNWIPQSVIQTLLGQNNAFAVVLATLVGAPMYVDIFGTLPIAEALVAKGVGIGTALSFMMAVTALSLPSLIMLKKVVKPKLLLVFVGIVLVGILLIGYLFNGLGAWLI